MTRFDEIRVPIIPVDPAADARVEAYMAELESGRPEPRPLTRKAVTTRVLLARLDAWEAIGEGLLDAVESAVPVSEFIAHVNSLATDVRKLMEN